MDTQEAGVPGQDPFMPMKAIVVSRTPKQKIMFIRQIRAISRLGLKEAKDVAELPPPFVLVVVSAQIADDWARKMNMLLGEPDVLVTYDAEPALVPVIANPNTALTEMVNKAGCAAPAAMLLLAGAGVLILLTR